jgi:glycosyltransferase involved in cell wall biosynthesis
MLRVLFDTSMLYIDSLAKRGIYYFTLNMLKYLSKYSDEIEVIPYSITKSKGLQDIIKMPYNMVSTLKKARDFNVDLIFIPHPRTFTHALVNYITMSKPVNVVVHDVHFLVTQTPTMYKLKIIPRYIAIRDALRIRDNIVITTVSIFSKYTIERYLKVEPDRVFVVYPGIDEIFRPVDKELARQFVKTKYGIENEYFIYVGAISKRKGVYDLIKAFSKFIEGYSRNLSLLLTGPLEDSNVLKLINKSGNIKYLGHVPRGDLPMLFSAAMAFIYPSYHEGFGLPPLEAAACGTPVIVSRIPVFLETIGDAGIFVDPGNVGHLVDAMSTIIDDRDLRTRLSLKALARAKLFTWERTVKNYVKLWWRIAEWT